MKNAILIIIAITLVIASFVAFNIAGKAMRDAAIDGCYQAGRVTITNSEGNLAEVPDNFWFSECMEKKGYEGETAINEEEETEN